MIEMTEAQREHHLRGVKATIAILNIGVITPGLLVAAGFFGGFWTGVILIVYLVWGGMAFHARLLGRFVFKHPLERYQTEDNSNHARGKHGSRKRSDSVKHDVVIDLFPSEYTRR